MAWDQAAVDRWLEARVAAARADQVAAERQGRGQEDECDRAAAEEMVCAAMRGDATTKDQDAFVAALKALQGRDDYVWRGVHDDARFDRHVRSYLRKLMKMAKTGEGFGNLRRFQ